MRFVAAQKKGSLCALSVLRPLECLFVLLPRSCRGSSGSSELPKGGRSPLPPLIDALLDVLRSIWESRASKSMPRPRSGCRGGRPPTLLFAEVDEKDENSGGKPDNERLDRRLGSRCAGASDKNGSLSLLIMLGNGRAGRVDEVSELDRDLGRAVTVLPLSMEDRGGSVNGGRSIGIFSYDEREADLSDADEDERLSEGSE